MATVNLLTSSFNGKLGAHYGVAQHHKKYIKATPFSHTPHNLTQTKSVRAFEILNRVSARVASEFFQYLPLSDKTMSKMNAVAQFFKPTISQKVFNPAQLTEVFGTYESFSVITAELEESGADYLFTIQNNANENTYTESYYFLGVFSPYGVCKGSAVFNGNSFSLRVPYQNVDNTDDVIIILRTVKRLNKFIPFFAYAPSTRLLIIENGIMYCERFSFPGDIKLSNDVLTFSNRNFSAIQNSVAILID